MSHISLVTLGVDDLEAATRFYVALGWVPSPASVPGTVTFLRGGNVALALFGRHDLAADAGREVVSRAGHGAVSLSTNLASPAEVDELVATAREAGATVTRPPEPAEWGGYAGHFADPDGHLWEVAHNPFFELLEDGRVELPLEG